MAKKIEQNYYVGDVIQIKNKAYKITGVLREKGGRGNKVRFMYGVEQVSGPTDGEFIRVFQESRWSNPYTILIPSTERLFSM